MSKVLVLRVLDDDAGGILSSKEAVKIVAWGVFVPICWFIVVKVDDDILAT